MPKRWSEEDIKRGFKSFYKQHKRLPTSHEIDLSPQLPSSRMLQKRFGGLPAVRSAFGYKVTSYSTGENRSRIASVAGALGREYEAQFKEKLQRRFGAENVRAELPFFGRHRVDFSVTTEYGTFGIDVVTASSMRTLQSSLNIKMKKFRHFTQPLFLVALNKTFTQPMLDRYAAAKHTPFPPHIELVTEGTLHKRLRVIENLLTSR